MESTLNLPRQAAHRLGRGSNPLSVMRLSAASVGQRPVSQGFVLATAPSVLMCEVIPRHTETRFFFEADSVTTPIASRTTSA